MVHQMDEQFYNINSEDPIVFGVCLRGATNNVDFNSNIENKFCRFLLKPSVIEVLCNRGPRRSELHHKVNQHFVLLFGEWLVVDCRVQVIDPSVSTLERCAIW
eukprot:c13098_g2_i1.p1 GENE.c13098_g2_i1~~c13098_g2_i1.p1  ORF type:complete len:103 (+),score=10.59 c13098_g2_i1:306-614(+)